MTTNPTITPADREAAWYYRPSYCTVRERQNWHAGVLDGCAVIRAFARHREQAVAEKDARIAELEAALRELLETHDEDEGMDDFPDSDSVGAYQSDDGEVHELPLTFGILRRARQALEGLRQPKEQDDGE